jgi:hypothetical protein
MEEAEPTADAPPASGSVAYLRSTPRLCALALLGASVGAMAFFRLIDGDEGFFLVAARLVAEGQRPYHDFFFIHAPMVPYVYGALFRLVGSGWYVARALTGLIAVASGLLVHDHLQRTTGKARWALLGTALFAGSGMVLGWMTTAKTLGLSALFLVAGTCVLTRGGRRASVVAGLLLGLAASTRLYLGATLLCAAVYLLRRERGRRARLREVALLSLGGLAGLAPLLLNLVRDPAAFWFGTVQYHALRDLRHAGAIGDWPQKWATLFSVLGMRSPDGTGSLQLLALVTAGVATLAARFTPRNSLFSYAWITLVVVSLLPTPSYQQYFCLVVPFAVVEAVTFLSLASGERLWPLIGAGMLTWLFLAYHDVTRFTVTGYGLPGVYSPDRAVRWSIPTARGVARAVDEQGLPSGGSWWPGYFVGARTAVAVDLVNDFGMVVADRVPVARRRRFHIVTHGEVTEMIHRHDPPLFVEGNWAFRPSADQLPKSGYKLVRSVGPVNIWAYRK